jgi:hypothetical protein
MGTVKDWDKIMNTIVVSYQVHVVLISQVFTMGKLQTERTTSGRC